ncbi:MAG TPA: hypothetical protein VI704_05980 [Bacteroidota bacterium]|nr:hypothetical protein [Bacteroidota bacterium]
MTSAILEPLIVLAIIAVLILGIVKLIKEPKGAGFASLTAFHDLQAKDKQAGIEAVIEQQAQKKMEEQESGKDNEQESEKDEP